MFKSFNSHDFRLWTKDKATMALATIKVIWAKAQEYC